MLMGEFTHGVDKKNRIIIPSKMRESLGDIFYISKGLDGCLWVFPEKEWKAFSAKLEKLPLSNKNARDFKRFFLSGATEMEPDKMGRVLLPASLMEYAGILAEVVSVGMTDKVEIWSKEKWKAYQEADMDMEEVAASLEDFGI